MFKKISKHHFNKRVLKPRKLIKKYFIYLCKKVYSQIEGILIKFYFKKSFEELMILKEFKIYNSC